ncbi:hypothetical protein HNP21_006283 [Bacillus aryabhattai]|uniref:Uncharacterized protein n=1 Tax=Priestia aryabhattai TaxID=412384 RepID=A0A7W3NHL7_PRIAR|nr:hypothetical protein [Priestia aryabhattai]MBA9043105.1 hypothetical protein [Priestia aryabhattai]
MKSCFDPEELKRNGIKIKTELPSRDKGGQPIVLEHYGDLISIDGPKLKTLKDKLRQFDDLAEDTMIEYYVFNYFKTLGELKKELDTEIENELFKPTIQGAYSAGYVNGLVYTKKRLIRELMDMHNHLFVTILFPNMDDSEFITQLNEIVFGFEEGEYDYESTMSKLREVLIIYCNDKGIS